jgi:hypothetical protein
MQILPQRNMFPVWKNFPSPPAPYFSSDPFIFRDKTSRPEEKNTKKLVFFIFSAWNLQKKRYIASL